MLFPNWEGPFCMIGLQSWNLPYINWGIFLEVNLHFLAANSGYNPRFGGLQFRGGILG